VILLVFAFWAGGALATILWLFMDIELLRRDGSPGETALVSFFMVVLWFVVLPYIVLS
jgi:hypothetical protein